MILGEVNYRGKLIDIKEYKNLAIYWHQIMNDKIFLVVKNTSDREEIQFIVNLGGEIVITRNANTSFYDYFMNKARQQK